MTKLLWLNYNYNTVRVHYSTVHVHTYIHVPSKYHIVGNFMVRVRFIHKKYGSHHRFANILPCENYPLYRMYIGVSGSGMPVHNSVTIVGSSTAHYGQILCSEAYFDTLPP